jgi:sRNA-binding regulator protein Hfq
MPKKKKRTNRQTMIYKHYIEMLSNTNPNKNPKRGEVGCPGKGQ